MLRKILVAFVLVLGVISTPASAQTQRFNFNNNTGQDIMMVIHSQDEKTQWPVPGRHWLIPSGYYGYGFNIRCKFRGHMICFGAKSATNSSVIWGVGFEGKGGCPGCCYRCGRGDINVTLTYTGNVPDTTNRDRPSDDPDHDTEE